LIATVEILGFASGGKCVARVEGRVIFVRGVLPGEVVKVEIPDDLLNRRYADANLLEIIAPSVDRINPPCKYFGSCGGCDWQHLSIDKQKEMQMIVLSDQLSRIGKFSNLKILPIISAPNETGLGYRTKIRFAISSNGNVAMHKVRSNELIEIQSCLIADSRLDDISKSNWEPNCEIILVAGSEETLVLTDKQLSAPTITHSNQYGTWQAPAGNFWQVHKLAPKLLIEQVLRFLNPQPGDLIADLYSGVGLFALPLAERVESSGQVVSVEFDLQAHKHAVRNLAHLPWAKIVHSDVAKYLSRPDIFSKAVVDPPRSGLNSSVIERLNSIKELTSICYVSCDGGTLARDLREFVDLGWQIDEIQPLFLFPMTAHLETVVSLTKLS
jgi:tRNA/tmRNA/rRNA uracil-C5-methylase (TrmA/RlmC/RlmD family)